MDSDDKKNIPVIYADGRMKVVDLDELAEAAEQKAREYKRRSDRRKKTWSTCGKSWRKRSRFPRPRRRRPR